MFAPTVWQSHSCRYLLPLYDIQNFRQHFPNVLYLWLGQTWGFCFPNGIVGDSGTELFKSHKTGTVTGKTGRTGSLSRSNIWGHNFTVSHFCFLPFKCFSITSLMVFSDQFVCILRAGFRVLSLYFCFSKRYRPGSSLFTLESVIFLLTFNMPKI